MNAVKIGFNREDLLAVDGIWSSMRAEVATLDEFVQVPTLCTDALEGVVEVAAKSRLLIFPKISEQVRLLREVQREFVGKKGTPGICSILDPEAFKSIGAITGFPTMTIDYARVERVEPVLTSIERSIGDVVEVGAF